MIDPCHGRLFGRRAGNTDSDVVVQVRPRARVETPQSIAHCRWSMRALTVCVDTVCCLLAAIRRWRIVAAEASEECTNFESSGRLNAPCGQITREPSSSRRVGGPLSNFSVERRLSGGARLVAPADGTGRCVAPQAADEWGAGPPSRLRVRRLTLQPRSRPQPLQHPSSGLRHRHPNPRHQQQIRRQRPRLAAGTTGTMPAARAPPSEEVNELQLEVTELKCNVDNLERERDFYYAKVRVR